jgi:hypothetical protein
MKKIALVLILTGLFLTNAAIAKPSFKGENFSGEYLCKGKNETVGDYEVLVKLKLNTLNSYDNFGVYDYKTETVNQDSYYGQIVAKGRKIALTFKLSNAVNAEFSTGIGEFKKIGKRSWAFTNSYYEPDNNAGSFGTEYCKPYIKPKVVKKND